MRGPAPCSGEGGPARSAHGGVGRITHGGYAMRGAPGVRARGASWGARRGVRGQGQVKGASAGQVQGKCRASAGQGAGPRRRARRTRREIAWCECTSSSSSAERDRILRRIRRRARLDRMSTSSTSSPRIAGAVSWGRVSVAAATPSFPPPSPKSTETAVNAPLVARRHKAARIRPKSQRDAVGGSCAPGLCWRSDPALAPGRRSPVGACALGRVVVAQATLSGASPA